MVIIRITLAKGDILANKQIKLVDPYPQAGFILIELKILYFF